MRRRMLSWRAVAAGDVTARGPVKVVIRPERVGIDAPDTPGPNRLPAIVGRVVYLGSGTQVTVVLANGQQITALVQNTGVDHDLVMGRPVACHLPPGALDRGWSQGGPDRPGR